MPAVDNGSSPPAGEHAMDFAIRTRMFGQREMMNGVHGNRAIKRFLLEGQIRKITHNEQAMVTDPLTGFTQGLNGNIQTNALLISLRIDFVFFILHRTRACIQKKFTCWDKSIHHTQACLVDVFARNGTQVFVTGILIQPVILLLPADLIIEFAYFLFCVVGHSISHFVLACSQRKTSATVAVIIST